MPTREDLERRGHALEGGVNVGRQIARSVFNTPDGVAERHARRQVEGDGNRRQLPKMRHRERADGGARHGHGTQGNQLSGRGTHVEQVQCIRIELELREQLQQHPVVVGRRINVGNLP